MYHTYHTVLPNSWTLFSPPATTATYHQIPYLQYYNSSTDTATVPYSYHTVKHTVRPTGEAKAWPARVHHSSCAPGPPSYLAWIAWFPYYVPPIGVLPSPSNAVTKISQNVVPIFFFVPVSPLLVTLGIPPPAGEISHGTIDLGHAYPSQMVTVAQVPPYNLSLSSDPENDSKILPLSTASYQILPFANPYFIPYRRVSEYAQGARYCSSRTGDERNSQKLPIIPPRSYVP